MWVHYRGFPPLPCSPHLWSHAHFGWLEVRVDCDFIRQLENTIFVFRPTLKCCRSSAETPTPSHNLMSIIDIADMVGACRSPRPPAAGFGHKCEKTAIKFFSLGAISFYQNITHVSSLHRPPAHGTHATQVQLHTWPMVVAARSRCNDLLRCFFFLFFSAFLHGPTLSPPQNAKISGMMNATHPVQSNIEDVWLGPTLGGSAGQTFQRVISSLPQQ